MGTSFVREWERFLKRPENRSILDLDVLLLEADLEETLMLIEQSVTWLEQVALVPGGKTFREEWKGFIRRAFAHFHCTRRNIEQKTYCKLLKRSLVLAQRAQELLEPGMPSLTVWRVEDALRECVARRLS